MHVAILDGDVSYPMTSGKRLRTLNLLLKAAKRHRITYIGRCAPGSVEAREAPPFLRSHGIEPILVEHPVPQKTGVSFYARLFGNLFSGWPYSVTSHQSEPFRQAVANLAKKERVDLWQVEWTAYLPMIDQTISGPRVVIAHNVDTLIWQRYYETESNFLKRAFLKTQWTKFRRFEEETFRQATRVVAVSEDDARLIREQFGQPNVDVVDNGIDRSYFEVDPNTLPAPPWGRIPLTPHPSPTGGRGESSRSPLHILFLGALDWRPNLDAVGLLLDRIFPKVLAAESSARLVIVGRHPPADLMQRAAQTPGVELHADVPDVRVFLGACGVMAVPLRIGGGSRLKILEALASGLPVVASRVGAEGLLIKPGQDYVQAEEDAMADALVQAIRDPVKMQAMAQQGRQFVLDTYDWGVLANKLETTWERCLSTST